MGSKRTLTALALSLGTAALCWAPGCGLELAGDNCPGGGCPLPGLGGTGGEGADEPEISIDGVQVTGAIFCSECAKSPFCYDKFQDPPFYVYVSDPSDACPDMPGFNLYPSEAATSRGTGETFYCARPAPAPDFNVPSPGFCMQDLLSYSFVDECGADSDDTCMGDACTDPNGPCDPTHANTLTVCGAPDPPNQTSSELSSAIGNGYQKIIDEVARNQGTDTWNDYGEVPGYASADPENPDEPPPAHYCFVTCFAEVDYEDPISCDPADDPWVSATSTFVELDEDSEVTVTVGANTSSVDIEGIMAIDIPRACRDGGETATCNVTIGSASLKASNDFTVEGFNIGKLRLTNRFNWTASASADAGLTTITLDSAPALITAKVPPFGPLGIRQELAGLGAEIDWAAGTYQGSATFRSPLGNGDDTEVTLSGRIANIPPRADAGADETFECNGDSRADVELTADGTDPESSDLAFVWSRRINGNWVVSSGPTLTTRFPLGDSDVILTAIDRPRAKDMDGKKVTVVDTVAPDFVAIDVAPGSLWPANGRLHLFTLGDEIQPTVNDICDPAPAVRIVDVTGSGDISFGDETICIRAASGAPNTLTQYSVTIEAIDSSGNVSTSGHRISNADYAPVVGDDDPRCP